MLPVGAGLVGPVEALENTLTLLFGHAGPGVAQDELVFASGKFLYRQQDSAAPGSVAEGIVQQRLQALGYAPAVADTGLHSPIGQSKVELYAQLPGLDQEAVV